MNEAVKLTRVDLYKVLTFREIANFIYPIIVTLLTRQRSVFQTRSTGLSRVCSLIRPLVGYRSHILCPDFSRDQETLGCAQSTRIKIVLELTHIKLNL